MTSSAPSTIRFVAYYRVSTERQGRSGSGLDTQRVAVARHAANHLHDELRRVEHPESL